MGLITYLVLLKQLRPLLFGDKFSRLLIRQVYTIVKITQPNYSSAEKEEKIGSKSVVSKKEDVTPKTYQQK